MRIREITGIGWRADAALRGGHGEARVLAVLSTSIYVDAGGEVLWVGARDATPHARAIHASRTPDGCDAGAGARADTLARACAADDPARSAEAATALLGLGPGLTPAGDDFTGGAFFARALLARAGIVDAAAWQAGASAVRTAAARLTHPIGAALLGDLLAGEGWAPLHDLAAALARDDEPAALDAAGRLTRLGHSSGWDLLAGFVAGARA